MQNYLLFGALALALIGCLGGDGAETSPQVQPPVIVVQAPPDRGQDVRSQYESLAWETISAQGSETPAAVNQDPNGEPYEVVTLLREFDPQLTDAPKDGKGTAADDLLSAFIVMDAEFLYGRMTSRAPMTAESTNETRFWLQQDEDMVTVEVKVGTADRPCELGDANAVDAQNVVPKCFWLGTALDFRIPLDSIPSIIDTSQPYWVSGFQTCCQDEGRNDPYDSIEGAQEVWRVPGLAAEVDVKGGDASPSAPPPEGAAGG